MSFRGKIDPFDFTAGKRLGNYYVKKKSSPDWFEGAVSPDRSQQRISQPVTDSLVSQGSKVVWLVLLVLGLSLLAGRVFYLQFFEGPSWRAIAEGNRVRILDINPQRGLVYDRNSNLLVKNVPSFSLAVVPVDLPKESAERQVIIDRLIQQFNLVGPEVKQKIESQPLYSYQPVIIKENLSYEEAVLVKIENKLYPGVVLLVDSTRQYLVSKEVPSFSHLLGYLGKITEDELPQYLVSGYSINDKVGKTGLESTYEETLKGEKGKEQIEVNAKGETKEVLAYQEPVAGNNLVLAIDTELQKYAEASLSRVLQSTGKKRGAVIILDPRNGEIISLVSLPAFDNNSFALGVSQEDFSQLLSDENKPLFNRAVTGEYPSGSTFKLIVSAAALQEKLINQNTSFNSVGGIAVDRWFFPDWKAGGHGWTNVTKAIAESVNTFFYTIGGGYNGFEGLGVARIKDYAEKFGLNKKLGVDLPNEAAGFLPSKEWKEKTKNERWYIGDTYNMAIGQGDVLVTPLQIAAWTSVFANGGILYRPHLVKSILDPDSNLIKEIGPQVLNQNFIDPENIEIVKKGLRQAVLSGSARALGGLPIDVGAKTGTAQWSSKDANHAWITTIAPYQNPEVVVTVLVEEGGEGSSVALPVAVDVLNWWAQNRYLNR